MIVYARCLSTLIAASALLGVGRTDPQDSMVAMAFMMSLAGSAQDSASSQQYDVRSFRVTYVRAHDRPIVGIHDQERNADKFMFGNGPTSTVYNIGLTTYFRSRDGQWNKFDAGRFAKAPQGSPDASAAATASPARKPSDEKLRELPDRRLNGVLMGAFSVTSPASLVDRALPASQNVTTTCLYEKKTHRLRLCSAPNVFTATIDRYNDPANRFMVPAAALKAPEAFRDLR